MFVALPQRSSYRYNALSIASLYDGDNASSIVNKNWRERGIALARRRREEKEEEGLSASLCIGIYHLAGLSCNSLISITFFSLISLVLSNISVSLVSQYLIMV